MCAGREPVTCYYRGKVVAASCGSIKVQFKSYGQDVIVVFNEDKCVTPDWEDLKIIK
jgi:hypothetical protein